MKSTLLRSSLIASLFVVGCGGRTDMNDELSAFGVETPNGTGATQWTGAPQGSTDSSAGGSTAWSTTSTGPYTSGTMPVGSGGTTNWTTTSAGLTYLCVSSGSGIGSTTFCSVVGGTAAPVGSGGTTSWMTTAGSTYVCMSSGSGGASSCTLVTNTSSSGTAYATTLPSGSGGSQSWTYVNSGTYYTTVIVGSGGTATYSTIFTSTAPSGGTYGSYVTTTYDTFAGGSTSTTIPQASCDTSLNFIENAYNSSADGNWIGGIAEFSSDNPCGVQGAIYTYSDIGLDGVVGTMDDAVQSPPVDPKSSDPSVRMSPCSSGRCCISGRTYNWPKDASGAIDYTADVWGGGIGIELNSHSGGTDTKLPYNGSARGFVVSTSGTLNGQVLRLAYSQSTDSSIAPFREFRSLGTEKFYFTDVICPTWADTSCYAPSTHPYDLQLQIVGGDIAGPYEVCLDSVTPLL